jgi:hypothetical protein
MLIEKFPLQWPVAYHRTKWPEYSRFGNQSFAKCRDEIFKQLCLMLDYYDKKTIVLSTNIPLRQDGLPYANYRQPDDKGVAVYFQYKKESIVICCDRWNKIEHNLWACAKTIEAMRGIERWGVSDFLKRSFTGFNALPPKQEEVKKRDWWIVFGYEHMPGRMSWDWEGVQGQYKSLAKKHHPDIGGSVVAFQELNTAYEEAKIYFK